MTRFSTAPTRSELRDYCILLPTVSIGTTALACAQIGPLRYHPFTAFPLFIVSLSSLSTVINFGVPDEYHDGHSFKLWRWAIHHGTGILSASLMTFYAFITSVFKVGQFAFH